MEDLMSPDVLIGLLVVFSVVALPLMVAQYGRTLEPGYSWEDHYPGRLAFLLLGTCALIFILAVLLCSSGLDGRHWWFPQGGKPRRKNEDRVIYFDWRKEEGFASVGAIVHNTWAYFHNNVSLKLRQSWPVWKHRFMSH